MQSKRQNDPNNKQKTTNELQTRAVSSHLSETQKQIKKATQGRIGMTQQDRCRGVTLLSRMKKT